MSRQYPLVNKEIFELIMWLIDPKAIEGALKSAIHAHGPIDTRGGAKMLVIDKPTWVDLEILENGGAREVTTCGTSSAAKRIRGALKTRAIEYLKEHRTSFEKKVEESVSQPTGVGYT